MPHDLAGLKASTTYAMAICALVLLALPIAVTSAHSAPAQDRPVEILVNGAAQPRYAHDGRWYVEALKGREYAIRLRNPYPVRVAIALSVDGLNTIDARHTDAANARKWVLDPYETVTISGWQISSTHARKFEFTTEEKSYAQALGKAANLGVIAAAFFRERVPAIARETFSESSRRRAPAAPSAMPMGESAGEAASLGLQSDKEYAATGMGQRTGHAVTLVSLDLEQTPAQTVNIRYEFRAQLVRLGILPSPPIVDRLKSRERSRGFEAGFSPEVR